MLKTANEVLQEEVKDIKQDVKQLERQAVGQLENIKQTVGPGLITGAADDDPSGIATYSITGARFGFSLNWLVLLCLPMMIAVQDMAGRIGLVTGKGLAGLVKEHYSRPVLLFAVLTLVVANVANIGANLAAIAAASNLVFGGSDLYWAIGWTIVIGILMILVSYRAYAGVLKFLTLSLLAYVATAFVVNLDWVEVLKGFRPQLTFDRALILTVVGFLGTTISPYLFFWQTSEEVEERRKNQSYYVSQKQISAQRLDTVIGMIFSQIVAFFIVVTAAATLHQAGITTISSAQEAALALKPLAGEFAFGLFAFGIIGTGLLAVPVLAGSAAYAIAEAFGWKQGLNLKFGKAKGFYGVILVALGLGVAMNFFHINPIKALFYTAVLNGLVSPLLIILMARIASNRKIMGEKTNAPITIYVAYFTAFVMILAGAALIWSFF